MGIQQCEKCNTKLKWFQIVKSIWLGYKPIQCSGCGKTYSVNFKSRYYTSMWMVIPLFLFAIFFRNGLNLSIGLTIGLLLPFALLLTSILPFTLKYSSES
ncbi:CXXC-20-CXXC protein OS=Ureibacillus acetophenoni OX=614649 GN=SAMN05877842_12010 PE=4 SV=1 [Ureibacillus acetophenoni]